MIMLNALFLTVKPTDGKSLGFVTAGSCEILLESGLQRIADFGPASLETQHSKPPFDASGENPSGITSSNEIRYLWINIYL